MAEKLLLIEKFWPLPLVEKRRFWPFFLASKIMKRGVKAERDGDYVFYNAGALLEKISFLVLAVTLFDLYAGTSFLVDHELLVENKTAMVAAWGKIMGPTALIVGWLSYLRIRWPMDIEHEQVPFFLKKDAMRKDGRRMLTQFTALMTVLGLVGLPLIAPFPFREGGFFSRVHALEDLRVAVFFEILYAIAIGGFVSFSLSCALVWEKAYRFYDKAREDMENW